MSFPASTAHQSPNGARVSRSVAGDYGAARGKAAGFGPDIAWFTDPAGNILSVLNG